MARMGVSKAAVFTILVVLCLISAAARAQLDDSLLAAPTPTPAPGPDTGSGLTLTGPSPFVCFSVLLGFVALLLQ